MMKINAKGRVIYENHATPIDGLPFIFVHVPKTGGTSIRRALTRVGFPSNTCHQSAAAYHKKNGLDIFSRLPGYAIIRNPFDRIVSSYYFGKSRGKKWPEHRIKALRESKSFEEFCEAISESYMEVGQLLIFKPQTDYVCSMDGTIDLKLWPMERIDGFWNYLNLTYFGGKKVQLDKSNRSKHPHFMDCHTSRTIEIVQKFYTADLELYESLIHEHYF